ncbi:PREDICTED: kinesin-like protein KIF12 [Priapulus caudatus]|uniref:Kinesin-like protein KIF12 n=1 Tax=Priapulus caudatus TaxID=37621 RepID=A0ABM1E255_PRICU|nr:PREDICTED: kinesin-like protein KIF12 [Priapulus caudatus]
MKQHLSQDDSPCLRDHDLIDSELIQLSSTSLYDAVGVGGARVGLGVSTSNLTLYNGSRHSSVNSTRSENGRTGSGLSHYVHVAVRIRPLSNDEIQRKDRFLLSVPQAGQISVENEAMGHSKTFCYNQVFQPLATQEEVFHNCGITHLIDMAVNGYSCTTFAYGQTGSGKTHTITGPVNNNREGPEFEANWGLIQRSFLYLFDRLETRPGITYVINASYLEIYNEQVLDLLNPAQKRSLAIRWSKEKGFYVENLFVVECECLDDLLAVLDEGLRNRQTRSNTYNEYSSRSHSMLTLQIDIHLLDRDDDSLSITKHGKLSFVDLAGFPYHLPHFFITVNTQ